MQTNRLSPIHWPEVTKLEPEVREQLLSVEKELTAVINNKSLPEAARADAYGKAGKIYQAYSLTVPARECYGNATLLAPKDFRWLYLLAKIDQQEGRVEDAIRRFESAGKLKPEYLPVQVNLGNIYLELNRVESADASFNQVLAQDPKNAVAFYGLGQLALSGRHYADAVSYFEKALQQVPGANRIHYSLALAYRGLGDLARAESHLAQRGTVGVRVIDPLFDELLELIEGERIHLVRGRTAFEAKRFADAAKEFRKAIAASPDSVAGHLNLATALVQMNELDAAVIEFKTALRLDPENTNAHFNLAIVLDTQNKFDEAAGELQALLKTTPGDAGARLFLGKELVKAERRPEALAQFVLVMNANPDNEEAVLQAVALLLEARAYGQALALLEKSNAQYPKKTDTAATLAYLLAASPQFETRAGARALELAQRAFQTSGLPQHGAIVALALAELGRCSEASDWQRRMIALAEQQRESELANKLKGDLKLYENKGSCRPAGQ
ncbi:MAG TPA: tetratricopeptide repeat protein [Pyrinomonadaceae bacterium]|nr:tetratricopeptide repeat protein [Pyrinomonadaceae bacterium]